MPNYGLAADTSVICWPLGTTEINEVRNEILVYPNPSNSFLILESNVLVNKENTILLYDVLGQLVLKKTIFSSTNKIQLDIHSLSNGLYTLRIDKFAKKIIKD